MILKNKKYKIDKNEKGLSMSITIEKFVQSSSVGKDGVGEWVKQELVQLFTPDIVKKIQVNTFKTISALKDLAMTTHRGYFFRIKNEENEYEYYHYSLSGGSSNLDNPYFVCVTEKAHEMPLSTYLEARDLPQDILSYYQSELFEDDMYETNIIGNFEDVEPVAFWGVYTRRQMEELVIGLHMNGLRLTYAEGNWIIH